MCGAYRGEGEADGGDVGKSGKIRCGGLPKGLGLSGLSGVQRRRGQLIVFFCFFRRIIFPGKGAKYSLFGATAFFAAVGPCRVMSLEKEKEKKFQLKKRQRFRKNHRRGHQTRARARINITPQAYGTEEVY